MLFWLLTGGMMVLFAIISSKLLYRVGIPTLLLFILLGMFVGEEGPLGFSFDNAQLAKEICSFGLIFILFYGGFGMRWSKARRVALPASLMATVGVAVTAGSFGLLAAWVLRLPLLDGLILGAVVSSTDAACVFSILRTKKLNLKGGLASLLEMESGGNDPMSYLLTVTMLSVVRGQGTTAAEILFGVFRQFAFAAVIGAAACVFAIVLLKRIKLEVDGLSPILVMALVVLCFAATEGVGGNGYLSVYILGVALGNARFAHRRSLVHFFDGISWLVQIALFFTLGLLVTPSRMIAQAVPALLCVLLLLLVARPLATALILTPFKFRLRAQLLVAWAGLRGVASIVFATFVLAAELPFAEQLFNLVFFICMASILLQGSLLPFLARKLNLVNTRESVYKTFNDYPEEMHGKLVEVTVDEGHPWKNRSIIDANIPESLLIVMLHREGKTVTPKGSTVFSTGDKVVITSDDLEALGKLSQGIYSDLETPGEED
ncbi:MAG: potassium/proton antiporter [Oscillospiraceae bacterium]|nr:potassium/proton antiporter [Oscillospiraceae bacterium]